MERNREYQLEWQRTVWFTASAILFIGTLLSVALFHGTLVNWGQANVLHQAALAAVIVIDAALVLLLLSIGRRRQPEPVRVWARPKH